MLCYLCAEQNSLFTLIYFPFQKTFLFNRAHALSIVYLTLCKAIESDAIKFDVLKNEWAYQEKVSLLIELGSAH